MTPSRVLLTRSAGEDRGNVVVVNELESRVDGENLCQRHFRAEQDHARLIQIGIGGVGLLCALRVVEEPVEVVTVEVVASVDSDGKLRHIPHQKSSPVQRVVERALDRAATQEVDG